jgi:hypothetical protein
MTSQRQDNFQLFLRTRPYLLISIAATLLFLFLSYIFTDYVTLQGNKGNAFLIIEIITSVIIAFLFGLTLGLLSYKIRMAATIKLKESGSTLIGSFLGILVTGCPACSITLASYLGLASIITLLPFSGLELKIISIGLLIYSNYSLLGNLSTCTRKK